MLFFEAELVLNWKLAEKVIGDRGYESGSSEPKRQVIGRKTTAVEREHRWYDPIRASEAKRKVSKC